MCCAKYLCIEPIFKAFPTFLTLLCFLLIHCQHLNKTDSQALHLNPLRLLDRRPFLKVFSTEALRMGRLWLAGGACDVPIRLPVSFDFPGFGSPMPSSITKKIAAEAGDFGRLTFQGQRFAGKHLLGELLPPASRRQT